MVTVSHLTVTEMRWMEGPWPCHKVMSGVLRLCKAYGGFSLDTVMFLLCQEWQLFPSLFLHQEIEQHLCRTPK